MKEPFLLDIEDKDSIKKYLKSLNCDHIGIEWMSEKAQVFPLVIKDVKSAAANILKQQMLSLGGEAAVGRGVVNLSQEKSDVLLLGTIKHYRGLIEKLIYQPWGLKDLSKKIERQINILGQKKNLTWKWTDRELEIGKSVLLMGILNVTPDSFSDGGLYIDHSSAIEQAKKMVEEGADIIDVGGESTRPGSKEVSLSEEQDRVLPLIKLLTKEVSVPISVDTYKSQIADEALKLGVHIINDVGGGKKDPSMADVVSAHKAPVIIMHNPVHKGYEDLISDTINDLAESIDIYKKAGVADDKIAIDPGIGFGKNPQENLLIMKNLKSFKVLGYPILLGTSRKSFIGAALDNAPVDERLEGSLATVSWGVTKGVDFVRAHDVKETKKTLKLIEAIRNAGDN